MGLSQSINGKEVPSFSTISRGVRRQAIWGCKGNKSRCKRRNGHDDNKSTDPIPRKSEGGIFPTSSVQIHIPSPAGLFSYTKSSEKVEAILPASVLQTATVRVTRVEYKIPSKAKHRKNCQDGDKCAPTLVTPGGGITFHVTILSTVSS